MELSTVPNRIHIPRRDRGRGEWVPEDFGKMLMVAGGITTGVSAFNGVRGTWTRGNSIGVGVGVAIAAAGAALVHFTD